MRILTIVISQALHLVEHHRRSSYLVDNYIKFEIEYMQKNNIIFKELNLFNSLFEHTYRGLNYHKDKNEEGYHNLPFLVNHFINSVVDKSTTKRNVPDIMGFKNIVS